MRIECVYGKMPRNMEKLFKRKRSATTIVYLSIDRRP
mgnify:CR=1 FL=1